MDPHVQALVGERPTGVCSNTAAVHRLVGRQDRARVGQVAAFRRSEILFARENAVAEPGVEAKDFIVAKARLEGEFPNDVWRGVEGITRRRGACSNGSCSDYANRVGERSRAGGD